jgi:transposase
MLRQATQGIVRADGRVIRFGGRVPLSCVQRIGPTTVKIIEQIARERPCPVCGVLSWAVKDRPLMRVKDLPACGQTVELWWRKRPLWCGERLCPRRSFTQTAAAVRPRGRVAERLRYKIATAIAGSDRSVADVAAEQWLVVADRPPGALVAAAAWWLPVPEPTAVLGIEETRHCARSQCLPAGAPAA